MCNRYRAPARKAELASMYGSDSSNPFPERGGPSLPELLRLHRDPRVALERSGAFVAERGPECR